MSKPKREPKQDEKHNKLSEFLYVFLEDFGC